MAYGMDFPVDPRKCALLVVDLQNDFLHPNGIFPRNGVKPAGAGGLVTALVPVIEACRRSQVPVIYARMLIRRAPNGMPVGAGLLPWYRHFLLNEGLTPGSWGARVVDELPAPDCDVDKTRHSAFYHTDLEDILRGLGVEILMLSGYQSHVCVESSARDAFSRDFKVLMLSDCMAAADPERHRATLQALSLYGQILDSKELLQRWSTSV
jgi:ureidoacrylate peracid hydrolase